jgi:hypothetical protein
MPSLFSGAALKATVEATLAKVPPEKTMAVVTTIDERGINVALAVRAKGGWKIGAALSHDNATGLKAGASVEWSR